MGWTTGRLSFDPRQRREDFSSSLCVQTGFGPTQPSVQWVPGVSSLGLKRGRGVTLATHPHLMPRLRMSRSYTPLHPSAFVACSWIALAFSFLVHFRFWISLRSSLQLCSCSCLLSEYLLHSSSSLKQSFAWHSAWSWLDPLNNCSYWHIEEHRLRSQWIFSWFFVIKGAREINEVL
jgi:hypothetical protein